MILLFVGHVNATYKKPVRIMVNITGLALLYTSDKLVEMVEWQVKVIKVICQSESSWSKHLKKLEYMLKDLENLEYARKSWKLINYLHHHSFKEHERIFLENSRNLHSVISWKNLILSYNKNKLANSGRFYPDLNVSLTFQNILKLSLKENW